MVLNVICQACGRRIKTVDSNLNNYIKCPQCSSKFIVCDYNLDYKRVDGSESKSNETKIRPASNTAENIRPNSDNRKPHQIKENRKDPVNCYNCYGAGEVTCSKCKGTGHEVCPSCNGEGTVTFTDYSIGYINDNSAGGMHTNTQQCIRCNSTGYLPGECPHCGGSGSETCSVCSGSGKVTREDAKSYYTIRIIIYILIAIIICSLLVRCIFS